MPLRKIVFWMHLSAGLTAGTHTGFALAWRRFRKPKIA